MQATSPAKVHDPLKIPEAFGNFIKIPGSPGEFFEFSALRTLTNAFLRIHRVPPSKIDALPTTAAVFNSGGTYFYSRLEEYAPVFSYDPASVKQDIKDHPTPRQLNGTNLLRRVVKLAEFFNHSYPVAHSLMQNWRNWDSAYYLTLKMIYMNGRRWSEELKGENPIKGTRAIYIKKNESPNNLFTVMCRDTARVYVHISEWLVNRDESNEKYLKFGIEILSGRKIVRLKPNKERLDKLEKWRIEVEIQMAIKAAELRGEDLSGLSIPLDIIPYEDGDKIQIYLPWYEDDLLEMINRKGLKPMDQLKFMYFITKGVATLHRLGYAHHDLKPENIMLNRSGLPVIIDFAFGQKLNEPDKEFRGTKGYLAPGASKSHFIPVEAWDAWTLGMVLDMILNQRPSKLFLAKTEEEFNAALDEYHNANNPPVSSLRWVIKSLLIKDDHARMTPTAALPVIEDHFNRRNVSEIPIVESNKLN